MNTELCAKCGETAGAHHMGGQEHTFTPTPQYRDLGSDEVIQEGDEYKFCDDPWRPVDATIGMIVKHTYCDASWRNQFRRRIDQPEPPDAANERADTWKREFDIQVELYRATEKEAYDLRTQLASANTERNASVHREMLMHNEVAELRQKLAEAENLYGGNSPCGHLRKLTYGNGTIVETCMGCEVDALEKERDQLRDENERLRAALIEIQAVACGERQVADDDTDGLHWIYRAAKAAIENPNGTTDVQKPESGA